MRYKNAELFNVEELVKHDDGSVSWLRIPQNVYDTLEVVEQGQSMAKNSTGVEIRFVLKGDKAVIRMAGASGGRFHVYRGGVQGGWFDHEVDKILSNTPHDFIIERSDNLPALQALSKSAGYDWDPEVIRVIFDQGCVRLYDISGDILPPAREMCPKKTLFSYGSSITHGSNSIDMSHSWVSLLAHSLNMDARNLGMAGSCAMEEEFAEYIASEGEKGKWDICTLELGINVLGWEEDKIRFRAGNIIRQVAGRNPNQPVFVISPFYYAGETLVNDQNPDKWRRLLKEITEDLQYPNVTYIDGLEVLDGAQYMSADESHPNIYGVMRIASKLEEIIKVTMKGK